MATPLDWMILLGQDVPFNKNESLNGATHSEGSPVITVNEAGDYLITFELNYSAAQYSMMAITVNGDIQYSTSTPLTDPSHVKGSAQLTLEAGDSITLRHALGYMLQLVPAPQIGAKMEITKIK